MSDNAIIPPLKQCLSGENCLTPSGPNLPETTEYFNRQKRGRNGLCGRCKNCTSAVQRENYHANPEKGRERTKRFKLNNPEKVRESDRKSKQKYAERDRTSRRKWYLKNIDSQREIARSYYWSHREQCIANARVQEQRNKGNRSEATRRAKRKYFQLHPEERRISVRNRRAIKRFLPATMRITDWGKCLEWWNGCCAYCGKKPKSTIQADHFIPISSPDCPGTVLNNLVPACRDCNPRKSNKPAQQWLTETFGKNRAGEIITRIETYFEWIGEWDVQS